MINTQIFDLAKKYIPGGVNSPVRSFNAVGGIPFFTKSAKDCYLYDIEGNQYIDYISSWGANIVGHANPLVIEAIKLSLEHGLSYGTPTELEVEFAKQICNLMPSIAKFRLVSSGTEAVMSAIRLARGYTGKKYIIKFIGCYHGHSDNLLVNAGSGLATFNTPSSLGVLAENISHTLVLEYNDTNGLENLFRLHPDEIAAVILEPFAGNMNLVKPSNEFLGALRRLCDQYNSVLIFDEVMTGFRVDLTSAQGLLNIKPDLTTLGKVIGGGMPLAGFGGRDDIMNCLAPLGGVYQAGTLSGNPIAVTAGLATLSIVQQSGFYESLTSLTKQLVDGLVSLAHKHGVSFTADCVGGMFGFYFSDKVPSNYKEAATANLTQFKKFFNEMLKRGVYFAPSMFEAGFINATHDSSVIARTLDAADDSFYNIRGQI